MKGLILCLAFIFTSFTAVPPQRLAVLPKSMSVGENLSSLCIDAFRAIPSGMVYDGGYRAEGFSEVIFNGTGAPSQKFLGESSEDMIPEYYKSFIERKIQEYDKGIKLTEEELGRLQDEIWAFNALDMFEGGSKKYIDRASGDQITEFENAKKNFRFDFPIDEDSRINAAILERVEQIRSLRARNLQSPTITDLTLTEDAILCKLNGDDHTVPIHYEGASFDDLLEAGREEIKNDFFACTEVGNTAPNQASISSGDGSYTLVFSVPDELWGDMQMRYNILNVRTTKNQHLKENKGQTEAYAKRK